MNREKFIDICGKVMGFFDYLNDDDDCSKAPPISRLIHDGDFPDDIRAIIDDDDGLYRMMFNIRDMAFVIGFVLGSEIEVTNLEVKADIEAVRNEIKDKQLLPYLPKERRQV